MNKLVLTSLTKRKVTSAVTRGAPPLGSRFIKRSDRSPSSHETTSKTASSEALTIFQIQTHFKNTSFSKVNSTSENNEYRSLIG